MKQLQKVIKYEVNCETQVGTIFVANLCNIHPLLIILIFKYTSLCLYTVYSSSSCIVVNSILLF